MLNSSGRKERQSQVLPAWRQLMVQEMETSVMLALHPELVRTDLLEPDGEEQRCRFDHKDMLEPGRVGQFRLWNEWSEKGAIGDPTVASTEKGELFIEAAVDAIAELIVELKAGRIG